MNMNTPSAKEVICSQSVSEACFFANESSS